MKEIHIKRLKLQLKILREMQDSRTCPIEIIYQQRSNMVSYLAAILDGIDD